MSEEQIDDYYFEVFKRPWSWYNPNINPDYHGPPPVLDDGTPKPILSLPPELLLEIFTHLEYISLLRVQGTCRLFYDIVNKNRGKLAVQLFCHSDSDLKYPPGADTAETEFCFALHPALHKLSARFPVLETRNMEMDHIGFKDERAAGYLRICGEMSFMNDTAFAPGTSLQDFMKEKDFSTKVLYLVAKGPRIPHITVRQFIEKVLELVNRNSYHFKLIGEVSRKHRGFWNFLNGFCDEISLTLGDIHVDQHECTCFCAREAGESFGQNSLLAYFKENEKITLWFPAY